MTLYAEALEAMERELFPDVLNACGWNQSEACRRLGLNRTTLRTRMKLYGICVPENMKRVSYEIPSPARRMPYSITPRQFGMTAITQEVVDANRRVG